MYTAQLKKITKENFPSDQVNPAIVMCASGNNYEHRQQATKTTVAIYQVFGFDKIDAITAQYSGKQVQLLQKDIPELAQQMQMRM